MSEANEDFLTDPLVGLCATPMHLMNDDELREYAIGLRNLRQSFQSYKAEVERAEAPKTKKAKPRLVVDNEAHEDEFKDFEF